MKKIVTFTVILVLALTLSACSGEAITPNEPYDMNDGIEMGEYKENIVNVGADIAGLQEVDHLSERSGKKDFLQIFREGVMNNVS